MLFLWMNPKTQSQRHPSFQANHNPGIWSHHRLLMESEVPTRKSAALGSQFCIPNPRTAAFFISCYPYLSMLRHPKIPKSSYYFGPPPSTSAYGTPPVGVIGKFFRNFACILPLTCHVCRHPPPARDHSDRTRLHRWRRHHPIRSYISPRARGSRECPSRLPNSTTNVCMQQLTPTQFLSSINSINEILISAHSIKHALWDNMLQVLTLGISAWFSGGGHAGAWYHHVRSSWPCTRSAFRLTLCCVYRK